MATVTIKRHATHSVSTYTVDFTGLSDSRRPLRLNFENGKVVYAGIARLHEPYQTMNERQREFATALFAIDGVMSFKGNVEAGLTITKDSVRVCRDATSTIDEEVEAKVVETISRYFNSTSEELVVVIDDYQRSDAFTEARRRSDAAFEAAGADVDLEYFDLDEATY